LATPATSQKPCQLTVGVLVQFGRVTDQSTGQGIADVAVVALGNQSGTRVAVTDAQGNYSVTLGANTDIFLRAYKSTYIFNPITSEFVSFGGFPIVGTITRNLTGTSFPC